MTDRIEKFLDEIDKTCVTIPDEEEMALGCLRAEVPAIRAALAALGEERDRLRKKNQSLRRRAESGEALAEGIPETVFDQAQGE